MSTTKSSTLAFNRGIISRLGLSRVDLERTALSAEEQTNWLPMLLGPMTLRPGLQYVGGTYNDNKSRSLPFVFAIDDKARVELTDLFFRIWVDFDLLERETVTAAITNGTFDSNVAGWTDSDESGATSQWQTGGYLALLGTGTNAAIRDQLVTCNQSGTEHAVRVVIARGPVSIRIGSTSGDDDLFTETVLGTGTHSLAFTPVSNFYIRLFSRESYTTLVDSIAIESSGTVVMPSPYAEEDLKSIRYVQSGDILYLSCALSSSGNRYQQRIIKRVADNSWSIELYEPLDGPFRNINATQITMTPAALSGDTTVTSSKAFFKSSHVGSLIRIESEGQTVTKSIAAQNTFSDPIRVTGIDNLRIFSVIIAGTFVGTVTLQYSIAEPGNWVDTSSTWTAPVSTSHDDGLDNQIIFYRIGIKTGAYTSGTADVTLTYSSGSIVGVGRITAFTSATVVSVVTLQAFGSTSSSVNWWEARWSDYRGWPSAVALHEGRLWWAGNDKIDGSVSDNYYSFDDETEGDSGPISRSIGEGPVENINWMVSLARLMVGIESYSSNVTPVRMEQNSVLSARSNSFDEPLTPTNFNLKYGNTSTLFIDQSGSHLLSAGYDLQANDFQTVNLSLLVPELKDSGVLAIAVQRNPDPRVHCILEDGTAAVLVMDKLENVQAWFLVETDGIIEDVCILPRALEDEVYYTIRRETGNGTVRFHERWARLAECQGGTLNRQADAFYVWSGTETDTVTGIDHLEGMEVVVWANGKDLGTYTVSGGEVGPLTEEVEGAVIGLSYEARFKSVKQGISLEDGRTLNQSRNIDKIGLVLADTHKNGLEFGPDFDNLDPLPDVEDGAVTDSDHVWEEFDKPSITFPGEWTTDARICLRAQAPRPVTVMSITLTVTE